MLEMTVQLAW